MYVTFLLYLCRRIEKATFDNLVLYLNPYIVVTKKGYTKHYYAGSEKIATAIGQGRLSYQIDVTSPRERFTIKELFLKGYYYEDPFMHDGLLKDQESTQDIDGQSIAELEYQSEPLHLDGVEIMCEYDMLKEAIYNNENNNGGEDMVFFSHSDHLGSANWVTDKYGKPIQYMHYAPYGEMMAYKNFTDGLYEERYKFTGKERDGETGYDYFGARYFWSAFGHWLSVDPLSDRTPGISSYAYCGWNPVNRIDPDGRIWESAWDGLWLACDGASFLYNTAIGNSQEAAMDAASFTADGATLLIPGVPAVAGPARVGAKLAPKVAEATSKVAKAIDKVITATKSTYRKALQQATGKLGKGYEAHHTLPQAYRDKFEKLGINIDDPEYVVWRKAENHRAGNTKHNAMWKEYFENPQNQNYTKEDILKLRKDIEKQVWPDAPKGETPIN